MKPKTAEVITVTCPYCEAQRDTIATPAAPLIAYVCACGHTVVVDTQVCNE